MEREKEKLEFDVPEIVRGRAEFFGLDFIGWVLFAPILFIIVPLLWWLIPSLNIKLSVIPFLVIISYLSFRIDEKTGEMMIEFVLEYISWSRSEKEVSPKWGEQYELQTVYFEEIQEKR